MPCWDLVCQKCHTRHAGIMFRNWKERNFWLQQWTCSQFGGRCDGELKAEASAPIFEIRGFSAKNGYAK